jgi:hypothetical protein
VLLHSKLLLLLLLLLLLQLFLDYAIPPLPSIAWKYTEFQFLKS